MLIPNTRNPNIQTTMNKPKVIFGIVALFVILCTIVIYVLAQNSQLPFLAPLATSGSSGLQPTLPEKNIQNPLTGIMYTEADAKSWLDTRPLAVMVNNHPDAKPQSGLIDADLVYEIVAEGGITRFLSFYLTKTPIKIGPVRSTREYYLVLVKELGDAMLMHIGYSPQALAAIESWPVRSLARGGATFWRDSSLNVATEHTAYVNGQDLRKKADELGWQGVGKFDMWKFKDSTSTATRSNEVPLKKAAKINVDFWYKGDFSVTWEHDVATNTYKRFLGYDDKGVPKPHIDRETKEQIKVKNVIVQFADETSITGDDKNRLTYQLLGSGSGLIFFDGKVITVTWSKADRDTRTKFYDQNGQEIEFNRGNFWISIVPDRNVDQVKYE